MHYCRHILFLAFILVCSWPEWAHTASVTDVRPRIFRLENGLTVLVREDNRFPLVSVRLYAGVGAAKENPEESGLSHFLEHMVFKGSKTRETGVDTLVENAGGYLNAYTSYDVTVYLTDLPSAQWRTAIEAVRDLAFDPLLRPEDMEAEVEVILAEMKQRGDMPYSALFNATFSLVFKGTPYERPVIGREETVRAVTPETMRAFIEKHYDPRDMLLVVAGQVEAAEVLAWANELFGGYVNLNIPEIPEPILPQELVHGLQVEVREGPWNKAYVSINFPIPGVGGARVEAADVLAHLLGGDDTALLPRLLRIENAVVDDVGVSAVNFERLGLFTIMAQMDGDKVESFVGQTTEILSTLTEADFTDSEVNRAKFNLVDNFWRRQETIAQIADSAGNAYFYTPTDPSGAVYLAAIEDVSREQLQSVLDQWIRPEAMSIMAMIPGGDDITALSAALTQVAGTNWPPTEEMLAEDYGDPLTLAEPEVIDLGGERKLVFWQDGSLPYVSAILQFSGGELFVPLEKEGLGSLAASLLTSATESKDYAEINAYLADRAAGLGASTGLGDFSLVLDTPSAFAEDIFALLQEVLTQPAFSQIDLERVKREQAATIIGEEESATGLMRRTLQPFLFSGSVYGHRLSGSLESLAALDRDDVVAFWEQQKTQPWVLSIVGDFDREKALAFAEALPKPSAPRAVLPEAPWNPDKSITVELPGREQAAYAMIFPTVELAAPESPAFTLLSSSLGGMGGMLYQELREKRSLGYSVSPMNMMGEKVGFMAFYIIAAPDNLEEARENFIRIANELHEDLLPQETLDRARAVLEAEYYRRLQTRSGRAANSARNVLYGRPVDFSRQRLDELRQLTPEDLRRIAQSYLLPDDAYSVQVVP